MKTSLLFVGCSFLAFTTSGQITQPDAGLVATNFAVVERSAHQRVVQYETFQTNTVDGAKIIRTNIHSHTELQTGLHKKNSKGAWTETTDEIELVPGGAAGTNTAHQVFLAANARTVDAVRLVMPNGASLSSHVLWLTYFDSLTGSNAIIAELQDSIGQLISANEVLYTNAFSGDCVADILYRNSRAGLEQNIILRTRPPAPSKYGISNAKLQVWTEVVSGPAPATVWADDSSGFLDQQLDFGAMQIGPGKAFLIGDNSYPPARVLKQWVELEGRKFLVEQVPVDSITTELQQLPSGAGWKSRRPTASWMSDSIMSRWMATGTRSIAMAEASRTS